MLWGLAIWGQIKKPTKSSQWVAEAYRHKEAYANSIHRRKIVLVSGSNVLFGVESNMLSKALGYPVVNDAVNAGVGLPAILMHAKRIIKQNDIVILPLEYPLYSYNGKAGEQMIDHLYAREPQMIKQLTLFEKFWIFWHVKLERIIRGYTDGDDFPVTKGLYGAHNIDQHGDQIYTAKSLQSKEMKQEIAQHMKTPEKYAQSYSAHALGWSYLADFVHWCRKRDVKVIFMPSTLMNHSAYHEKPEEKQFYENIAKEVKKQGWNYVGEPYDYMYDRTYYFNTNFHLTREGRVKNTNRMIEDLKLSEFSDIF